VVLAVAQTRAVALAGGGGGTTTNPPAFVSANFFPCVLGHCAASEFENTTTNISQKDIFLVKTTTNPPAFVSANLFPCVLGHCAASEFENTTTNISQKDIFLVKTFYLFVKVFDLGNCPKSFNVFFELLLLRNAQKSNKNVQIAFDIDLFLKKKKEGLWCF
jgi:hypothetical protein